MHSINELRLHNLNAVKEVVESNQTKRRGDQSLPPGYTVLGEAISAINRKKITDPKKQKREIEKIRRNINR